MDVHVNYAITKGLTLSQNDGFWGKQGGQFVGKRVCADLRNAIY